MESETEPVAGEEQVTDMPQPDYLFFLQTWEILEEIFDLSEEIPRNKMRFFC